MNAATRWQELVAENLAGQAIPGFRRQEMSITGVPSTPSGVDPASTQFLLPKAVAFTNFSAGETRPTGVLTDVAIEGPGFFEVRLPNGALAYTRDGEFKFDAQGTLVTRQGYTVLAEGGSPIQKDFNNPSIVSISSAGEISQGTDMKGKLSIVNFNDPQHLIPIGRALFTAADPRAVPFPVTDPSVQQGVVEGSNISASAEMASLIMAMRNYEANQRLMQQEDTRMERTIRDLTGPN